MNKILGAFALASLFVLAGCKMGENTKEEQKKVETTKVEEKESAEPKAAAENTPPAPADPAK